MKKTLLTAVLCMIGLGLVGNSYAEQLNVVVYNGANVQIRMGDMDAFSTNIARIAPNSHAVMTCPQRRIENGDKMCHLKANYVNNDGRAVDTASLWVTPEEENVCASSHDDIVELKACDFKTGMSIKSLRQQGKKMFAEYYSDK